MTIRTLAIDDEPLALRQLVSYIEKIPFLALAGQCQSAIEAQKIMQDEVIDAIFIDINMPDLNGLDFIRQLDNPPIVVLTTAYSEYALEGYKINAVDYLLKPFSLDDFKQAAEKVKSRYELISSALQGAQEAIDDDNLFIKTDYRMVRISINNIRYVEGMSEYVKIHFCDESRPITFLTSMKKMEERLAPHAFMRIHRSYIINLSQITEVNKNRVVLAGKDFLSIGDLYREPLRQYIAKNTLSK